MCSKHDHMKDHVIHHLFCMFGHLVVTTHIYCHSNTQPGSTLMCIGNPSPAKAMFTIEPGRLCQVSYPIRQCVTPEKYSSCYTVHNLPMSSLTLSQGIHYMLLLVFRFIRMLRIPQNFKVLSIKLSSHQNASLDAHRK